MEVDDGIIKELLALVPQQEPFRFIDEIISVDEEQIVGAYRFREDEFFYRGHFPGRPVTPGVILIETMAQIGVVAFGMYLLACKRNVRPSQMEYPLSLFSHMDEVEFKGIVVPGSISCFLVTIPPMIRPLPQKQQQSSYIGNRNWESNKRK